MADPSPPIDEQDRNFLSRIQSAIKTVEAWDADSGLLAECRGQIPISELVSKKDGATHDDDVLYSGNALFLKRLTRYFKDHVMKWVNNPPCVKCGSDKTEARTTRGPQTDEEEQGGASRVEVYFCPTCQEETTTFPRYNSCRKLMETRRGRCGEFANLFGLYCRSVGFETRYVSDFTDHVWVECYVDGNWIMADSCEGLIDKYGMYESGWGKKLNYILGVTVDSVVDVTPRYTRKWFDHDFQARRRSVCSSEQAGQQIIQQVNATLRRGLPAKKCEELDRRLQREQKMLNANHQSTEWTEEEKHGQGRISGSLQWKLHRNEAGKKREEEEKRSSDNSCHTTTVQSWHVESFYSSLPMKSNQEPIVIHISPGQGISVAGAACSVVNSPFSIVVLDEAYLGCVLQSRGFSSLKDLSHFIKSLPKHRIVAIQGRERDEAETCSNTNEVDMEGLSRLGGFSLPAQTEALLYLGQVETLPAWSKCVVYRRNDVGHNSEIRIHVELSLQKQYSKHDVKLRTERNTVPRRVAWRLPDAVMSLKTQLLATDSEKRVAFLRFAEQEAGKRYTGYCTKPETPIYLLDASAYPFAQAEPGCRWNTFHFLPKPLVHEDDVGIVEKSAKVPKVDIPLDPSFTSLLGPSLMVKNQGSGAITTMDTASALSNTRLVALYFSAYWCRPCRSTTPMLAELYSHLKEEYPTHGLEIVFVTSDRDQGSFEQYFTSMPWLAIPFQSGQIFIQNAKSRFGVRGIPSLVVLDAMSGQIVVPVSEARSAVMQACQGGDARIDAMLQSWIARIPQESQEIMAMLELSYEETTEDSYAEASGDKDNPYLRQVATEAPSEAKSFEAGPLNGIARNLENRPVKAEPSPNDIASRVAELQASGNESVRLAVGTALKYLENAKREPWTPKFRSFKLSNKIVDRITRVEKGLDLICSFGLHIYSADVDFMACIPLASDLEHMENAMKSVLEAFPEG